MVRRHLQEGERHLQVGVPRQVEGVRQTLPREVEGVRLPAGQLLVAVGQVFWSFLLGVAAMVLSPQRPEVEALEFWLQMEAGQWVWQSRDLP